MPASGPAPAPVAVSFVAMLAVVATGCLPFGSVSVAPGLEGVVLSAEDGHPVGHAYVTIPEYDRSATTDGDGRFVIEPVRERRWFVPVLPGSSMTEFEVQAWHGDGAYGEAVVRVSAITSSFGLSGRELLILLVPEDLPFHPAFDDCADDLSATDAYTARLALRMEHLMESDAFREHYMDMQAWWLEDMLRAGLEHAAAGSCPSLDQHLPSLFDAAERRRYGTGNGEVEAAFVVEASGPDAIVATHRFAPRDRLLVLLPAAGGLAVDTMAELRKEPGHALVRLYDNRAGAADRAWWFAVFECYDMDGAPLDDRIVQLEVESAVVEHCLRDTRIELRLERGPHGDHPPVQPRHPPELGTG